MGTTSALARLGLLRTLVTHLRLAARLLRDPSVPMLTKALAGLGVLYLISPIDAVPDFIPLLGQLDDLGVLIFGLESFLRLCPLEVVGHHRDALSRGQPYSPTPPTGQVIEAEFRRE